MIWAKSFKEDGKEKQDREYITLSEHIKDILCAFESLKNKLLHKIPQDLLKQIDIPIKIAILYHDFGKVIPKFQIEKLGNKDYEPFDVSYGIPHSIFSIFWIDEEKVKEMIKDENILKFIISAVAYHHWRDSFENIIHNRDENLRKFIDKVLNEWKEKLEKNLKNEFQNFYDNGLKELIKEIKLNENLLKEVKNECYVYEYAIPSYNFDYYPVRATLTGNFDDYKKWILISGFLQRCDHFASFCEEEKEDLSKIEIDQIDFNSVKDGIKQKIKANENQIWQIQKVQNNLDKNIILIAPTGYGKTEFAFLWAAGNKFFYTLPLRSAVNQIFERAKEIFGEDKTGILHSDADVYLLEKEGDVGDTTKLYELTRVLSYPSIISTGDQFFPYALRPPGFEKVFATFSYAKLIVDEVQVYDPKACAIIVSFIEWICKMDGRFLLMTATLPEFVKKEIEEKIGNDKIELINIYDEKKEDFRKIIKHKIKICLINNEKDKFDLSNSLDEIIKQAQSGKRVLVILNTVRQAQNVYQKLTNANPNLKDKIFLLHSRFTLEDRRKKETELIEREFKNPKSQNENEGKILIATQVVEASLDIDVDVLFTEMCPLDSLVQRMGRVLRRYFYRDGKVINKSSNKEIDLNKYFRAYELENEGNPNVYVWIFKEGLESGKGRVYDKELLNFSIAWLLKRQKDGEISELNEEIFDVEIKRKVNEIFKFIKEQEEENKENKSVRKSKKGKKVQSQEEDLYEFIMKNEGWLNQFNVNGKELKLSEYEKYLIVSNFYKLLSKDGSYLREFYNTLDVLNSGYISARRTEAERIFREIYDVNVIPKEKIETLANKVKEFIKKYSSQGGKQLFAKFKEEILSKFIVSIPLYKKDFSEEEAVYYKVVEVLDLKEFSEEERYRWKVRLKSWLSGIFLAEVKYDPDKGTLEGEKEDKEDTAYMV